MSGKPAKDRIENGTTRFAQTISIFNPTQFSRSLTFSKAPSEVTASGIPSPLNTALQTLFRISRTFYSIEESEKLRFRNQPEPAG